MTENGSNPDPVLCGSILFLCSAMVIACYLFTLVAVWRVSRTSPPFLLFFSHGCGAVGYLLNIALLSLEITFGKEIPIPGRIMNTYIRVFDHSPTLHSVIIAMSRCFAIFMPLTYNKCAHNRKFFCRTAVTCWIVAIILTFVQNFCFGHMSDDAFPTHNIQKMAIWPKSDDAEEVQFQRAMEHVPLYVAVSCLFFYLAALTKISVLMLSAGSKKKRMDYELSYPDASEGEEYASVPDLPILLLTLFGLVNGYNVGGTETRSSLEPIWSECFSLDGSRYGTFGIAGDVQADQSQRPEVLLTQTY